MSSVEKQVKDDHVFSFEPGQEETAGRGFLTAVIVLWLIYFMTPRPLLYASILKWVQEALGIVGGWLSLS